jgi:hypothetical protein
VKGAVLELKGGNLLLELNRQSSMLHLHMVQGKETATHEIKYETALKSQRVNHGCNSNDTFLQTTEDIHKSIFHSSRSWSHLDVLESIDTLLDIGSEPN